MQVRLLQTAIQTLDSEGIPCGSWLRIALFRECTRVTVALSAGDQDALKSEVAKDDPGAALISAMAEAMSIPLRDLGDDHSSLTPGAVAHLTLKGFSVHDSKGDAAHRPRGGEGLASESLSELEDWILVR